MPHFGLVGRSNIAYVPLWSIKSQMDVKDSRLSGQGMADLPVQAEWVDEASQTPAVLLAYREHLGCAGCQGLRENCIRVGNGQNHSDRAASERLPARPVKLAVT